MLPPRERRGKLKGNSPMRKPATLYGPILSLPLFIGQLMFFLAPLLFLTALSFWTVRNFRMEPAFSPENWEWMLGGGAFWDAYFITVKFSASVAAIPTILDFLFAYAIASKLLYTTLP